MIKTDEYRFSRLNSWNSVDYANANKLVLLVFCLLLLSSYSLRIYAQEAEAESSSQQETTVESKQKSETDNEPSISQEDSTSETDSTFDVDVLVERMKETKAIGVITKLSLKNQVDDLLEKADEIKNTNGDATEEKSVLRENFEGLILKTVTLLNKGEDYTLAEDIYLAREELWKSIMENKA